MMNKKLVFLALLSICALFCPLPSQTLLSLDNSAIMNNTSFTDTLGRDTTKIIQGEYFRDNDDGEGNCIPLTLSYSPDSDEVNVLPFDVTGIVDGTVIYFRFKNSRDRWTNPRSIVYHAPFQTGNNYIDAGEYFINTTGNHVALPVDFPVSFTTSGLSVGDIIFTRFHSTNGLWGEPRAIVYQPPYPLQNSVMNIDSAEYYINSSGEHRPIAVDFPDIIVSLSITPPGLTSDNVIYARIHSTNGLWGEPRTIVYRPPYPQSNNVIIAGEYFRNIDQGTGQAIPIEALYGDQEVTDSIFVNGLTENETIYMRFLSSDSLWSLPRSVAYRAPFPAGKNKIIAGEYFLNEQPGSGSGIPIIAPYPSDSFTAIIQIPFPSASTIVYPRFQNSNMLWCNPPSILIQKPDSPRLVSPLNGSALESVNVLLTWSHPANIDTTTESLTYSLVVAKDSLFTQVVVNDTVLSTPAKYISSLQNLQLYYWKVRAKNNLGWGMYSATWSYSVYQNSTRLYPVSNGWNMLSLPLELAINDYRKTTVYPSSISSAYAYVNGGYVQRDTLRKGEGFWLKYSGDQVIGLIGTAIAKDTCSVVSGWNMIGSISTLVAVSSITSIPPNIVTSQFYGYSQGYLSSATVEPGKGYWVKVNQAGKLILSSTALNASAQINITPTGELPPSPPETINYNNPIIPDEFTLEQNYPNPFNPSTVIKYQLPAENYVTLKVYNMLGKEVATLVNEFQSAGFKSQAFEASSFPSGIYYYKLTAGEFVDVKKLLLIK